jgi:hypothetical protein
MHCVKAGKDAAVANTRIKPAHATAGRTTVRIKDFLRHEGAADKSAEGVGRQITGANTNTFIFLLFCMSLLNCISEMLQALLGLKKAAFGQGDKVAEGAAHIELADVQMDVDMVAATAHAQKALLIHKALKEQDDQAEAYVRLGKIKLMQGENQHQTHAGEKPALEAFKKAGVTLGEVWREGSRARVEIGADIALGLGTEPPWA